MKERRGEGKEEREGVGEEGRGGRLYMEDSLSIFSAGFVL